MTDTIFQVIGGALIIVGIVMFLFALAAPFTYSADDEEEGPK